MSAKRTGRRLPHSLEMVARYRIVHETQYSYASPVALSQQLLYLTPRVLPWQRVDEHRIDIDPAPTENTEYEDYFGKVARKILLAAPQGALWVHAEWWVTISARAERAAGRVPQSWEPRRDRLHGNRRPPLVDPSHFLFESPNIERLHDLLEY